MSRLRTRVERLEHDADPIPETDRVTAIRIRFVKADNGKPGPLGPLVGLQLSSGETVPRRGGEDEQGFVDRVVAAERERNPEGLPWLIERRGPSLTP